MSYQKRTPVLLVLCGSFNPVTVGHLKMFEIARNFMERIGTYTVIGGVLSPVHDGYKKSGLLPSKHRVEMCRLAVQRHLWLSVDSWESEQPEWNESIDILRHQAEKIKDYGVIVYGILGKLLHKVFLVDGSKIIEPFFIGLSLMLYAYIELYGVEHLPRGSGSHSPCSPTQSAVTLQPGADGLVHFPISYPIRSSASGQSSVPSLYNMDRRRSTHPSVYDLIDKNESLELNEASEPSLHDKTGVVLDKLSQNLKRMCCARPTAFDVHHGNMIYGAACDFRRTEVMLLCGGDLLESFTTPGLWKEEHVREIVSDFGIVCIPRQQVEEGPLFSTACDGAAGKELDEDKAKRMRNALDKLHEITKNISGTIILVNDVINPEIANISSTKCRNAIMCGSPEVKSLVLPSVLNYIQRNSLYKAQIAA